MIKAGTIQMASATDDSVYLINVQRGRKIMPGAVEWEGNPQKGLAGKGQNTLPMELVVSPSYLFLGEAILDKGQTMGAVGPLRGFQSPYTTTTTGL